MYYHWITGVERTDDGCRRQNPCRKADFALLRTLISARRPKKQLFLNTRYASISLFDMKVPSGISSTELQIRLELIRSECKTESIMGARGLTESVKSGLALAHVSRKRLKRSRWHSAHGRCPAANAVASSRKNRSVYKPGFMIGCRRPLNSSRQMIQRMP